LFARDGDDLSVAREVNVSDLALGITVQVLTPHGFASLEIPAGTVPGTSFDLPGFGVRPADSEWGTLRVRVDATSGGAAKNHVDKGTFAGLMDVLDADDVAVIPTVGRPYDPDVHEVVGKVEVGDGDLIVTGEVRRGYLVKGQVIRPALVTVSRAGAES